MTQPLQSHNDCATCALAWAHGWSGQCDSRRDTQREAVQRDTCTQHKRAALRDVWKHTIIAVAVSFAAIAIIYGIVQAAASGSTGINAVYAAMQHSIHAVAFELGFIGLICGAAIIHELCMRASDAIYDRIHTRMK